MKKILSYILLIIILSYFIYCWVLYLKFNIADNELFIIDNGYKCGIVVEDFTELCTVKHGTKTNYYLKIKYDNENETIIEEVEAKTFYKYHKVGSKVCLMQFERVPEFIVIGILLSILFIFIILLFLF